MREDHLVSHFLETKNVKREKRGREQRKEEEEEEEGREEQKVWKYGFLCISLDFVWIFVH